MSGFIVKAGDLAYLDTFSGLVPVKVLAIAETVTEAGLSRVECVVKVTAPRRGYLRGEVIEGQRPGLALVSREQVVHRRHGDRLIGQTIAVPDIEMTP